MPRLTKEQIIKKISSGKLFKTESQLTNLFTKWQKQGLVKKI